MNNRQRLSAEVRPNQKEIVMTEAEAKEYWDFCVANQHPQKAMPKERDKSVRLMFNRIPILVK